MLVASLAVAEPVKPATGDYVIKNFKFSTGEILPEVKIHYTTLGNRNSADDERNPPELGILEREIKRVKNGKVLLIQGSPDTAGHGTTGQKTWAKDLGELL